MKINGKEVKKVVYSWYDHCLLRNTGIDKHIEKAINNHDWKQFQTYQYILNNIVSEQQRNEKWIFLPNYVTVRFENDEWKRLPMTKELFYAIDSNEYECG